jgi:hypothetical protein
MVQNAWSSDALFFPIDKIVSFPAVSVALKYQAPIVTGNVVMGDVLVISSSALPSNVLATISSPGAP